MTKHSVDTPITGDKAGEATLKSYAIGFVLSIIFTIIPYILVVNQLLDGWQLTLVLVVAAIIQLWVQLHFFLHLGNKSGARWNMVVFLFMLLVMVIIVAGSLWIMNNLRYNLMSPEQMDVYMKAQSEKGF